MKPPLFLPALLMGLAYGVFGQNQVKINDPVPSGSAFLGNATAIHDNQLLVGAMRGNGAATICGKVLVGNFSGTTFNLEQTLTASDADTGDNFGCSVALYTDLAVVGASHDDEGAPDAGAAYVFRKVGSSWIQEQKIVAADADTADSFGQSVSVWDDRIAIGSFEDDNLGHISNGSVYIYRFNGTAWALEQKLTATGPSDFDFFGYSVSLYDTTLVAGAYLDDDMGINSGSAFVFRFNGSSWVTEQKLTATDGAAGDVFGFSIDHNDTSIVIGAYSKFVSPHTSAGAVYIFNYNGTGFTQQQKLTAPDYMTDDWFGYAVGLSGKTIVTTAFHDDNFGAESGSGYIYRYNGTTWIYELKIYANDADLADEFGQAIAVDNFSILVGAPKNDDGFSNAGSAYLFDLCTYTPETAICMITADSATNGFRIIAPKPNTTFIDSFIIERDSAGMYIQTNAVSYDSYTGEAYDAGFNIDNEQGKYRLRTVNLCGNKSNGLATHEGILLSAYVNASLDAVLNWTPAVGFSFPYYRVYRDDGTGVWTLLGATVSSILTYTDGSPTSSPDTRYVIEIQKSTACSSPSGGITKAYSNIFSLYVDGIEEFDPGKQVNVFPNPFGNNFTLYAPLAFTGDIEILTLAGTKILTFKARGQTEVVVDASMFGTGIYLVKTGHIVKKLVKL
ncbi:MAG TPA: T9SS type A sorting domain-containing protein, partial [Flavobacteriales bacterium]|nr:T9SS type A sorting domain-containing protein [Flavobacteriales bacterium]